MKNLQPSISIRFPVANCLLLLTIVLFILANLGVGFAGTTKVSSSYSYISGKKKITLNPSPNLLVVDDRNSTKKELHSKSLAEIGIILDPLSQKTGLKKNGLKIYRRPKTAPNSQQKGFKSLIKDQLNDENIITQPVFKQGEALLIPGAEIIVTFKRASDIELQQQLLAPLKKELGIIKVQAAGGNSLLLTIDRPDDGRCYQVCRKLDAEENSYPPPGWSLTCGKGKTTAAWGRTVQRAFAGEHSLYCAAYGPSAISAPGPAPLNMAGYLFSPPLDLSLFNEVYVEVWFYAENEIQLDEQNRPQARDLPVIGVTDGKSGINPDYCTSFGGTSSSCPKVAGVVALILSANPNLTPAEVKNILIKTADDIDEPGFDDKTGAGRVNAFKAVQMAQLKLEPSASPEKDQQQPNNNSRAVDAFSTPNHNQPKNLPALLPKQNNWKSVVE